MNFPLYIARHISPNRGPRRGAPAVKVAVVSVAISVAVMLAAVAIVNGFKREISAKVTGFNAHISLYSLRTSDQDDNILSLTPSLRQVLDSIPFVTDYSLQISIPGIFKTPQDFQGIYLKSLEGQGIVDFLKANLVSGVVPDYSKPESAMQIVISEIAAKRLGLKVGDRIDTYFFTNDIRIRPLKVAGIFNSHFDAYDKVYAYAGLDLIQKLGGIRPDQGTGMAIHTDNFPNIQEYTASLNQILAEAYGNGLIYRPMSVDNALNQGAGYFHWLDLLDTNVVVILTLMTFVAIITLISGLLIIILDKKRFIGLLRALGAPAAKVRKIFVFLALKVTVLGMFIGNALMIGLLMMQDRWHFLRLDPESYYIDFVPVELTIPSVLLLNIGVVVIVYLALILPSTFVARISPAETLRYE